MNMRRLIVMLIVLVICVSVSGCLWADADTKLMLNMDATAIAELNKRCQTGDINACKEGLNRATTMTTNLASLANGGK